MMGDTMIELTTSDGTRTWINPDTISNMVAWQPQEESAGAPQEGARLTVNGEALHVLESPYEVVAKIKAWK